MSESTYASRLMLAGLACVALTMASAGQSDSALVERALRCDLPTGQASHILQALKRLGAKPGPQPGDFILQQPVQLFGMPVTHLNIVQADEGVDVYMAVFHAASLDTVANAATLKPFVGGYHGRGTHGTLEANVRDRRDVWLSCSTE